MELKCYPEKVAEGQMLASTVRSLEEVTDP